jgi:hypothetical protein
VATEATAEPTEAGAMFRRDGLISWACDAIFRRRAQRGEGVARRPMPAH